VAELKNANAALEQEEQADEDAKASLQSQLNRLSSDVSDLQTKNVSLAESLQTTQQDLEDL
jgi:predicted  nucleic acid-binding Zn-ribbon protein